METIIFEVSHLNNILTHIIWFDLLTLWSRPGRYYYPDSTEEIEALKSKWLRLTRVVGGTAWIRKSSLQMASLAVFFLIRKMNWNTWGQKMLQTYRLLQSLRQQFYRFLHTTTLLPLPLFLSFSNSKLSNHLGFEHKPSRVNEMTSTCVTKHLLIHISSAS